MQARVSLVGVCAVAFVTALGLWHQPYHPVTWLDEGFVLQGAMNLAKSGEYAMRSSEGLRILDQPLVANGPGVVLPVAAVFAVFGVGLLQARLLMAIYFVVAAMTFFAVAKRLHGVPAALVSSFLLVALPIVIPGHPGDEAGFVVFGRQAIGNVPALTYFLAGYLLWLSAQAGGGWRPVAAGALFGLAWLTKAQYGILMPTLALVALLYWRRNETGCLRSTGLVVLAMLACQTGWWSAQVALVGWDGLSHHLDSLRSSSSVTVLALRPTRILGNLSYLLRSGFILVVGPALAYVAWSFRTLDRANRPLLPLTMLTILWLLWYTLVSVGWPRYAFEPYSLGLVLSGGFLIDAGTWLRRGAGPFVPGGRGQTWLRAPAAILLGLTLAVGLVGLTERLVPLFSEPDQTPQRFADYLRRNVGPRAVVESWEWEIDTLADLNYHHPTNDWVDAYTALLQFGEPLPRRYDPFQVLAGLLD